MYCLHYWVMSVLDHGYHMGIDDDRYDALEHRLYEHVRSFCKDQRIVDEFDDIVLCNARMPDHVENGDDKEFDKFIEYELGEDFEFDRCLSCGIVLSNYKCLFCNKQTTLFLGNRPNSIIEVKDMELSIKQEKKRCFEEVVDKCHKRSREAKKEFPKVSADGSANQWLSAI